MLPYLEFSSFEEYVAHLAERGIQDTHLDIGTVTGKMSEHGIQSVGIYAVATRRIDAGLPGEYIAVWSRPIYVTTNVEIRAERDGHPIRGGKPMREVVDENLSKVRAHFEDLEIQCRPGRWLTAKPEVLN